MTHPQVGMTKSSLQELPAFRKEMAQNTAITLRNIQIKKTDCKCSVAVLALIALLAAGGAAALIATSGGPFSNMFSFYSGVGLAAVSTGLMICMAVVIARAHRYNHNLKALYTQNAQSVIANDAILDAMLENEANREGIQAVVNKMRSAHFPQFVTLATQRIFYADREEALTAQEQAILSSIAQQERFVRISGEEDRSPLIALEHQRIVLENIPQDEVNAAVGSMGPELFREHANAAINSHAYPKITTAVLQDAQLAGLDLGSERQKLAMEKMTPEQASAFLANLNAERYQALAAHILTAYYGEAPVRANQVVVNALAASDHVQSLSVEQKRLLLEHVENQGQANALIAGLDPVQYQELAAHILTAYYGEAPIPANQVAVNAIADSGFIPLLDPAQQFQLIEQVEDDVKDRMIGRFNDEQYDAFVEQVNGRYFGERPIEVNQDVLKSLIFDEKRAHLSSGHLYAMINAMPQNEANTAITLLSPEQYAGLIDYQLENGPENSKLQAAIAQRPEDFAQLVLHEKLTLPAIHEVVAFMDYSQKEAFIRIVTDQAAVFGEEQRDLKDKMAHVVWDALQQTLTVEFGGLFACPEEADPHARALVQQFARWPALVGQALWPDKDRQANWYAAGMINAFWGAMNEESQRTAFANFQTVVNSIKLDSDEKFINFSMNFWNQKENGYRKKGLAMPEIYRRMRDTTYAEIAGKIQDLPYDKFRSLVTDNARIAQRPEMRYQYTLAILEHMDPKVAKRLIAKIDNFSIDSLSFGHDRYVGMFKILVGEARVLPPLDREAESDTRISYSRKRLYFLFSEAPQRPKVTSELKKTFPEDVEWNNFNELASLGKI